VVVVVILVLSLLRMPTSPGPVGVTGGVLGGASGSMPSIIVPSGMTGPGRALKGFAAEIPSRLKGTASPSSVFSERWRKIIDSNPSEFLCTTGAWDITLLRECDSPSYSLALYKVSTPSGIITIRAVPTSTPIPMVDINRSRDCERLKESGREPARKDLRRLLGQRPFRWGEDLRNSHDGAQSEQHEEAV